MHLLDVGDRLVLGDGGDAQYPAQLIEERGAVAETLRDLPEGHIGNNWLQV